MKRLDDLISTALVWLAVALCILLVALLLSGPHTGLAFDDIYGRF